MNLFNKSKRQLLTYLVLSMSFASIFYSIYNGADLTGLGTCLATVCGATLGYLWAETKRPS